MLLKSALPVINIGSKEPTATDPPLEISCVFDSDPSVACFNDLASVRLGDRLVHCPYLDVNSCTNMFSLCKPKESTLKSQAKYFLTAGERVSLECESY